MKNRFIRRGIILLISGVVLNIAGYVMKQRYIDFYGWFMIAGVVLFGIGFISLLYSLMRKVEAQSIIEERAEEKEKKEKFKEEASKTNRPYPA